jgi:hypothetical protein
VNKQTSQILAELFPYRTQDGKTQDGFAFSDNHLKTKDFWRLEVYSPSNCAAVMDDYRLEAGTYPHDQALVEKTLELIAEREGWDLECRSERDAGKEGRYIWHTAIVKTPYQPNQRKRLGSGEGLSRLEAMTAAMIAAKQGQS